MPYSFGNIFERHIYLTNFHAHFIRKTKDKMPANIGWLAEYIYELQSSLQSWIFNKLLPELDSNENTLKISHVIVPWHQWQYMHNNIPLFIDGNTTRHMLDIDDNGLDSPYLLYWLLFSWCFLIIPLWNKWKREYTPFELMHTLSLNSSCYQHASWL